MTHRLPEGAGLSPELTIPSRKKGRKQGVCGWQKEALPLVSEGLQDVARKPALKHGMLRN